MVTRYCGVEGLRYHSTLSKCTHNSAAAAATNQATCGVSTQWLATNKSQLPQEDTNTVSILAGERLEISTTEAAAAAAAAVGSVMNEVYVQSDKVVANFS